MARAERKRRNANGSKDKRAARILELIKQSHKGRLRYTKKADKT